MDKQGDYPIKVLIMAPLIMVSLPTVSSFSTRGCFLQGGRSPSRDPLPLSLACGWPPGVNGSPSFCRMAAPRLLGFKILLVQGKRDQTSHRSGLGRPAWAHLSLVRSPLRSRGSSCNYALCPLHLQDFDDVILASKMEVLFA
jgi:hypothetical protein